MTRRLWCATLLAVLPSAVSAQVEASSSRWQLDGSRGSFCVWYLADPALAVEYAPKGTQLSAAGSGEGLPPAVARVIRDEPRFASWIPAAICVGLYGKVTIDGEVAAEARSDRPILIQTHAIAAQSPRGVADAGYYLLELATDNGIVERTAENAGIRAERRELTRVPSRDGGDEALHWQVGKAKFTWSGHPTGEPRVDSTRSMSFGLAGMRTTTWSLEATSAPDTLRLVVGQLLVEGKDDLAKALKASPIRAVGPLEVGGRVDWLFQRGAGR
jgi:hypothetical protein